MKNILIGVCLLFLFGCASTTGYREDKTVKSELDFRNNTGTIIMYFPVDAVTSDESTLSGLGTTQDIAPKAETSLSRASQAGQAVSKLGAGLQMLEDMETYFEKDEAPAAVKPTVTPPVVIPNDPPSKIPVEVADPVTSDVESGKFHGRANGDRPLWYFSKNMREYPDTFKVVVKQCGTLVVTGNNGVRSDFDSSYKPVLGKAPDGGVVKQSDVSGRGMAVHAPSGCKSEEAYVAPYSNIIENARFHNRNADNDRPIWYFKNPMSEYPSDFDVTMEGCGTIEIRGNVGERIDFDSNYKQVDVELGSAAGGTFISQSRMPERNYMTMVGPASCKTETAYITLI